MMAFKGKWKKEIDKLINFCGQFYCRVLLLIYLIFLLGFVNFFLHLSPRYTKCSW